MKDLQAIQKLNALNTYFAQFCAALDGKSTAIKVMSWPEIVVSVKPLPDDTKRLSRMKF